MLVCGFCFVVFVVCLFCFIMLVSFFCVPRENHSFNFKMRALFLGTGVGLKHAKNSLPYSITFISHMVVLEK